MTVNDPTIRLVRNRLNEAENQLKSNEITKAQDAFLEALKVKGDHPNREADIRRAITLYCDERAEQPVPDWDNIHKAIDLLEKLSLQNEETQAVQRDLKLKEAQFLLEQEDNLDQSFRIFTDLLTDETYLAHQGKLKDQIARIVSAYISDRAAKQEWGLLDNIFTHVQAIWPAGDSIHDWLKTMAQIITAANQGKESVRSEMTQVITAANQAKDSIQSELDQEREKSKSLYYGLMALLILAAVAYPLAFILG